MKRLFGYISTFNLCQDGRRNPIPEDWDALERFAEAGGYCCMNTSLPGGMDPGEVLRTTRLSEGSIDWDALDDNFGKVQRGEPPPNPITRDYALAQGLFSNLALGQLTVIIDATRRAIGTSACERTDLGSQNGGPPRSVPANTAGRGASHP